MYLASICALKIFVRSCASCFRLVSKVLYRGRVKYR